MLSKKLMEMLDSIQSSINLDPKKKLVCALSNKRLDYACMCMCGCGTICSCQAM